MGSYFIFLVWVLQVLYMVQGDLQYIHGHLTDVRDNCTVGDLRSCGPGKCCVKDGVASIPEDHSVHPEFVIMCRPLEKEGHLCYTKDDSPFCPCDTNLFCDTTKGLGAPFGHCSRSP